MLRRPNALHRLVGAAIQNQEDRRHDPSEIPQRRPAIRPDNLGQIGRTVAYMSFRQSFLFCPRWEQQLAFLDARFFVPERLLHRLRMIVNDVNKNSQQGVKLISN